MHSNINIEFDVKNDQVPEMKIFSTNQTKKSNRLTSYLTGQTTVKKYVILLLVAMALTLALTLVIISSLRLGQSFSDSSTKKTTSSTSPSTTPSEPEHPFGKLCEKKRLILLLIDLNFFHFRTRSMGKSKPNW